MPRKTKNGREQEKLLSSLRFENAKTATDFSSVRDGSLIDVCLVAVGENRGSAAASVCIATKRG